jgi:hypothetical protein
LIRYYKSTGPKRRSENGRTIVSVQDDRHCQWTLSFSKVHSQWVRKGKDPARGHAELSRGAEEWGS